MKYCQKREDMARSRKRASGANGIVKERVKALRIPRSWRMWPRKDLISSRSLLQLNLDILTHLPESSVTPRELPHAEGPRRDSNGPRGGVCSPSNVPGCSLPDEHKQVTPSCRSGTSAPGWANASSAESWVCGGSAPH